MGSSALIGCGLLVILPEAKGKATAETDNDTKVSESHKNELEMT